jgi:hypothetical protein
MHEWKLWRAVHVKTDIGSTYDVYHFIVLSVENLRK